MTPEEELKKQVEDQEKKAKETIDSSIRIPLTEKQASILQKITLDRKRIQEEFTRLGEKESDLVTFIFEFKEINQKDVKEVKLSETGDALIVTMKPIEKKLENNLDASKDKSNGIQKEYELKLDRLKPHQPPKLVSDKPVA